MASGSGSQQSEARLNTAVMAVTFLTNIPKEVIDSVAHGMINEGKELNSKLLLQECWRQFEQEVHSNPHQTILNGIAQPLSLQNFSLDPPHGPAHGFDANTSPSLPSTSHAQNRPEQQNPRFASPSVQANELNVETEGDDCVDGGMPLCINPENVSGNSSQDMVSGLDQTVAATLTIGHAEQTHQSRMGATYQSPASNTSSLSQENSKSPSKQNMFREGNGKRSESNQESSGAKTFDIQQYLHDGLLLVEKEHELLSNLRKCSQCHIKPRNTTFLPCGHFTTCDECADPIYECPLCENEILATIPTYLS